jgi:hypothetical protein
LVLVLLLPVAAFGLSWGNGVNDAYTSPPQSPILKTASSKSLEAFIVQGASYFLQSSSDFSLFIQRYEQNCGDVVRLQDALNNTFSNMTGTKSTYYEIKNLARQTPYNQTTIVRY